jgi:hypothetical protein
VQARRAIKDQGFVAHDANVLFRANCPNIDLVVFGKTAATYVQVKASQKPAGSDTVIVDGSPWTEDQLRNGGPIFNKHDGFRASLIVIVAATRTGETEYYIAPPGELEQLLIPSARTFADRPRRDGKQRSIAFRKELPGEVLKPWLNAWQKLVPRHRGFDRLDVGLQTGMCSEGMRTSMLRATPGWRRMKPARSRVRIIWWTDGGVTPKCRWMSASAGGRRFTRV